MQPVLRVSVTCLSVISLLIIMEITIKIQGVSVYKYVNGIIDFKFDTKLISDIHSYNARGKSNFYLPRVRCNYGKQRRLYQGIVEWNSLDKSIRDMRSLLIVKQALKTAMF